MIRMPHHRPPGRPDPAARRTVAVFSLLPWDQFARRTRARYDCSMLIRFNASENGPSAALNAAEQRQREALAALRGQPGVVDITYGKIGDRWGFVVSMDRPAD